MEKASDALVPVLCFLIALNSRAAEPEIVYTRADAVEFVIGEATMRRAYVQRIELPWPECEDEMFSCVRDALYAQVYDVAFVEENVTREPGGAPRVERRDRGRLTIAVDFPEDVEHAFEGTLERVLARLAAPAYVRPHAGMRYIAPPLDQRTFERSRLPAWVCRETEGSVAFDVVVSDDEGQIRLGASRGGELARAVCGAIGRAVQDEPPTSYRSLPYVRRQARYGVRFEERSTLGGLTAADRLVPIPHDATFAKKRLADGEKTGGIRDSRDGVYLGHEGRYGEVERDVRLPAAALELIGAPMWVGRWSFESVDEAFGAEPVVDRRPVRSITVAVLPIADPLQDPVERARTALTAPGRRLLDATVTRFEREVSVGPDAVRAILADPEVWPAFGDWIVVSCEDGGPADWGIAPFAGAAEVTNARDACAAISRALDGGSSTSR